MTLTEKQIDALFKFTEENGVEYYDLQVELVDHLASGIEEEINNNNTLTPYKTLNKVFADFGKKGFAPIVKQRRDAVEEGNRKLWWKLFWGCFTLPRITLTALIAVSAFIISHYLSGVSQGYFFQVVVLGFPLVQLVTVLVKNISAKKRLLLLQQRDNFSFISIALAFILSPVPSNLLVEDQHLNKMDNAFFAIWFIILLVIEYATFETNRQVLIRAKKLYPEAFVKA